MATLMDVRTDAAGVVEARGEPEHRPPGTGGLRWVTAALLVGAAGVHFGMAPSHFGESGLEGAGFLAAAWLQVALAGAVVFERSRRVVVGVIAVSVAGIAAWAVSRTVGLPFGPDAGERDSVTIVDGLVVAMESLTVVLGGFLLRRSGRGLRSALVPVLAVVAVVAAASVALAVPEARDHAGHGDGGGSVAAGAGGAVGLNGEHVHGVKAADVAAESQPDKPLDPQTRALLREQLLTARATALQYPTVADAVAAGYRLAGGFAPGSGAHYIGPNTTGRGPFDATKVQSLIYDGTSPTSEIAGLMYFSVGSAPPEGFAGPNDHWHRHSSVCIKYGPNGIDVPLPADADITQAQCTAVGGQFIRITGWMVHAWVVPSWESPLGVFSHDNPNLRCADGTYDTDHSGFCQGT